jgi:hypothetical protein
VYVVQVLHIRHHSPHCQLAAVIGCSGASKGKEQKQQQGSQRRYYNREHGRNFKLKT